MPRQLADIISADRYNEDETSHNGGDFDRGYRRGWNHALRHVGRELGVVVSAAPVSTTEIAAPPAIDGNPSLETGAAPISPVEWRDIPGGLQVMVIDRDEEPGK